MTHPVAALWRVLGGALMAATLLVGCRQEAPPPDYVARLGDRYLLRADLDEVLASQRFAQDSTEATQQIVQRWVENELLYQEAMRLGLRNDAEVARLLEENERSILIDAVLETLYNEFAANPSQDDIRAYYEQNRPQLQLREPFVRVRLFASADRATTESAARALAAMRNTAEGDSLWQVLGSEADDPLAAINLSASYYPESRLFLSEPYLREALQGLPVGRVTPVIEGDSLFHVLQMVDRVPAGTAPEPNWIEDELRTRLIIQNRKLMYARQVQRLKNEALAREALEIK